MRVLHCPSSICFCKPSTHLCTAGPLKLEHSPHVPSTTVVSLVDSEITEVKEEIPLPIKNEVGEIQLKSCLRKANSELKQVGKKRVQWVDFFGKELAEIREFESSKLEDGVYEVYENRRCICVIL